MLGHQGWDWELLLYNTFHTQLLELFTCGTSAQISFILYQLHWLHWYDPSRMGRNMKKSSSLPGPAEDPEITIFSFVPHIQRFL